MHKLPAGFLHIRSNISEIGRAFYRRLGNNKLPLDTQQMSICWNNIMNMHGSVKEAFTLFIDTVNFKSILNYDPYDMFYWEHRMGTWLSSVLIESDVVFDTYHLFNCRIIAEKMMAVPLDARINSSVHHGIIKHLWPVLKLFPINQSPFEQQLNVTKNQLCNISNSYEQQLDNIKNSYSYRLGNLLVQAAAKPGLSTILLPYRLLKLFMKYINNRIGKNSET